MTEELCNTLKQLADKYENINFVNGDPSCVLGRYKNKCDIECAAFIGALLAFGRRDQFLKKTEIILSLADKFGGPEKWILGKHYNKSFMPCKNASKEDFEKKFYRFYSYSDFIKLFDRMAEILTEFKTLGDFFEKRYTEAIALERENTPHLSELISAEFSNCAIVPHGKNSANKRVNMFLRWMVRLNSPVDLGLWTWFKPKDLIIPLDTHVIQEAVKFGIIPQNSNGTFKTAQKITEALKEIWNEDPCKGDFALFGLGVDK